MPPAIIAAGVGAAASIGGAALSASSQKKTAKTAANTATQTTSANNALQREVYGQNKATLDPYVQRGNAAGNALQELLGLSAQAPGNASPATGIGNALSASYGAPMAASEGQEQSFYQNQQFGASQPIQAQAQSAQSNAQGAFNNFLNSSGFQFQMDQGNKAINQGYAARGTLQSGAALKALQDRGQQTALNNYFMPYLGLLQGQQGTGMGAASAVAGVGQNMANNVSANNNMAASSQMNAAGSVGQANAGMYSNIGNALGNLAGTFASSYGKPAVPPVPPPFYPGGNPWG